MKKKWFAMFSLALSAALFAASCTGTNGNEEQDVVPATTVTLSHTDGEMLSGESFDYASLFTVKLDGVEDEVTADDLDVSQVNPYHEGEYTVSFSRTVDGKTYSDSAKLTVVKSDVQIVPKSETSAVKLGEAETYDYSSLFTVTLNGKAVTDATADMATVYEMDGTEAEEIGLGRYYVELNYSFPAAKEKGLESDSWNGVSLLYVNEDVTPDLSSALRAYENFTLTRTIAEQDDDDTVSYGVTYQSAEKKFYVSGPIDPSSSVEVTYCYRIKSDGSVGRAWVKDDSPSGWRDPFSDIGEYYFRPDLSDYTEEEFSYLGGVFALDEDEVQYAGGTFFGNYNGVLGALSALELTVKNGALERVVGTFERGTITDVYSAIGTTAFDIPSTEPVVVITTNAKECFVNESFSDWKSMFTVTVDGKAHALTDEEAAKIDHTAVNFGQAGEYNVTLKFTAEDGETEYTATAKFTVKAIPTEEKTFAEALAAAAQNCTATKKTYNGSSETNAGDNIVNGAFTYDTKGQYLYKIVSDGNGETIQRYQVTNGALGEPSTGTYRFVRLDVFVKNIEHFTDSNDDGIYECTDAAVLSSILSACIGFGTASKAEIVFKNGTIVSVKIIYKTTPIAKTDSYHLYELSSIGSTELPFELPE